jgi:acetyl esterase/lipase
MLEPDPVMDDAYSNGAYIANAAEYPPRWQAKAAAFRAKTECDLDVSYGANPREVFDLFYPSGAARGVMIFVHGGYWVAFDKNDWSHLAAGAVARGWAVAVVSYPLAPQVRISEITASIASAVDVITSRVAGPVVLTGHSAGGHLVARMICEDQSLAEGNRIAHVVPISPVADLRPLLRTAMNADLRIDPQEAVTQSPALRERADVPVTVWVGENERPAFIDQAKGLATAWDCVVVVEPNRHHFDVIDGLEDKASHLLGCILGAIA